MSESNTPSELRRTLAALLDETTSGFEAHPDPEHLFAYSAGRLSAEEEEVILEHLSLCRDCLDRLWIDPADPLARRGEGVLDFETHKAWREMEARIRELRARRDLERTRGRSRLYQAAAAACLLLGVGLAGWKTLPRTVSDLGPSTPQVAGPAVNVGVFDVMRSRVRSGSSPAGESTSARAGDPFPTPLAVPEGFESFTLIFLLESGDYDAYELKILDSDREELWKTRDVVVQEDRATLSLSRSDFGSGDYFVEIYCWRQGEATIWEYPIHLSYP